MENKLPEISPEWTEKKIHLSPLFWLITAIITFIVVAGGTYYFLLPTISNLTTKNKSAKEVKDLNISIPFKPTPIPLAHGKQTYSISGSIPGAPRISEVIFDPIDPAKGSSFNLVVKTLDGTGVTGVDIILNTDNKSVNSKLNLSEGTASDGTWKVSIKMDDSYDYIYRLTIKAKNTGGKVQSNTITLR